MREPFDHWWKHQMEGFSLEPQPEDWEAIHRRLHPRRRRRVWFWLLPLLALLLGGGYAIWHHRSNQAVQGHASANKPAMAPAADKPGATKQMVAEPKTTGPAGEAVAGAKHTQNNTLLPAGLPTQHAGILTAPASRAADRPITVPLGAQQTTTTTSTNPRLVSTPENIQPAQIAEVPATPAMVSRQPVRPDGPQLPIVEGPAIPAVVSPKPDWPTVNQPIATPQANADAAGKTASMASGVASGSTSVAVAGAVPTSLDSVASSATGRSRRRGQFWAMAGVGGIWPQSAPLLQPGSREAAADFTINPGSGNTILRNTLLGQSGGPTLQAAALWYKPLGKRLQWSVGLGLQYGRWHQESLWFSDSILPGGAMAGSRLAATGRMTMQWWSLQVPMYLQGSWGRNGLGWVAGLRNLITLDLRQQERLDATNPLTGSTNNQAITDRVITTNLTSGTARTYVPQLAAGLYYQHRGKLSWRLQPMVYLPLSNLYLSGSSRGNAYPLQAGLGWQVPLK